MMKMKKIVFLSTAMLAVLFIIVAAHAGTANLAGVEGDVKVQLKTDGAWAAGTNGTSIPEGASIKTGVDGKASLAWGEGNVVKLYPLSIVKATEVSGVERKSSVISLEKGRAMSRVEKLATDASFELRTPTAVAGVRGTGFDTEIAPDTAMVTIAVVEGTVAMTVGDVEVMLEQGFESSALPGDVPSAPEVIPPAKLELLNTELSAIKVTAATTTTTQKKAETKAETKTEAKAETKTESSDSSSVVETVSDNSVENVTINDGITESAQEAADEHICYSGGVGCVEGTINIQY